MDFEDVPYAVKMHQSDALELLKSGAVLLILDIPPNSSFGLNTEMYLIGPSFRGVKMMLPGTHFVYYSSRSKHGGDFSPITGFFLHMSPSQVVVRKWDALQERLVKLSDSSEEERFALAARNMEFDRQLAPYDTNRHRIWQRLTNFISRAVMERIEPVGGDISVTAEASLVRHAPKTPAEKRLYEQISRNKELQRQRDLSASEEASARPDGNRNPLETCKSGEGQGETGNSGRCFYTRLPHLLKRTGMSASELTAMNIDKSQALEAILRENYEGQEELLLGELQFSFIAFLMGQSLEAFGQWKGIVSLLLGCEDGPLRTRTPFFIKFLGVLYWQLKQSLQPDVKGPNDPMIVMDDGWLADDNFLRLLMKEFLTMLRDATPVDGELLRQAKRLKKLLEETMDWDFDLDTIVGDEDDEYAPVIVYDEDVTMVNLESET